MSETIKIPLDEDVLGYLKTQDGLVILRKSIPETFEIADKCCGCWKLLLKKGEMND